MKRIVLGSGLGTLIVCGLLAVGCGGGAATGSGGSTGSTGTGGSSANTGGSTATGSGGGSAGSLAVAALPMCTTQAKDAACTVGDKTLPDCMVRCGPSVSTELRGYRPLICGADTKSATGVGFVQGACTFDPSLNYSCYKLPSPLSACPTGTMSGGACTAAACTACGDPVDMTKGYVDSAGAPKAGFCLCRPDPSTGAQTWTCGSNKEYPCYPAAAGASIPSSCN